MRLERSSIGRKFIWPLFRIAVSVYCAPLQHITYIFFKIYIRYNITQTLKNTLHYLSLTLTLHNFEISVYVQ